MCIYIYILCVYIYYVYIYKLCVYINIMYIYSVGNRGVEIFEACVALRSAMYLRIAPCGAMRGYAGLCRAMRGYDCHFWLYVELTKCDNDMG